MTYSLAGTFINGIGRQQGIPDAVSRRKTLSICVAAVIVGSSLIAVQDVQAAPKKSSKNKTQSVKASKELEAENALLRAQLEAVQKERDLLKQSLTATATPGSATVPGATEAVTAATEPAETVAAKEETETDNLGEVVVRAKPKLEKLHDVKQSVSVVSGKELDRELGLDLGAITRRSGNVQFNQANTRTASLSMRGVGKRTTSETQDPSVGVTVDGVSFAQSKLANFSFYDVDQVEVTRGPRGTEGGLTSGAGKINVTSKAPSFTPTAELSAAYGEREALILKGALGGPVIDDLLAWRGAFIVDKGRGFYTQEYDSNYSLYNRDRLSGRVQFLFTPTSNITAKLIAHFEPKQPQLQNGLTFYHKQPELYANGTRTDATGTQAYAKLAGFKNAAGVFTGPRDYFKGRGFSWNQYSGGEQRNTVWFDHNLGQTVANQGAAAHVNWDIGSHVLSSVTAVHEYSFDAHNDEGTPYDISRNGGGGVNYSQYSQEFKIQNKPGGFADYKAGLYGIKTFDDVDSKNGWGSDAGAWFATTAQYNALERNAGVNRGAGLALLKDSLHDMTKKGVTEINTLSGAVFGETDLHFTDRFTLTSGLRAGLENRKTRDNVKMTNYGSSNNLLNPVEVRGVQLGGFASATAAKAADAATGTPAVALGELLAGNTEAQLKLADKVAARYYGKTLAAGQVAGDAYKSLTAAQRAQIGQAKNIRNNQIGQLYDPVQSNYDDLLFTSQLAPSYKINDDITTYLAWQYTEKSGSALNVNGVSRNVKPENTHALEWGFKTFWLDKSIVFNIDAFVMDIHNYQQTVQVVNEYQTQININNGQTNPIAYTAAQGNAKKVRVHGVELDSTYNIIPELSLRFNGSYNIARYIDFKDAGKPSELAFLKAPYIDLSGKTLAGASKWTFNVGAEYTKPVFEKYKFHTSFNTNFASRTNNDDALSAYSIQPPTSLTDASFGVSTKNNAFDLSFIVKNLFNNTSHENGWASYSPNPYPAWFGVQVSGKI